MDLWLEEIKGDPDEEFLSDGLRNGFQLIPAEAKLQSAEMNNYHSATDPAARDKVEEAVLEELAAGNYFVTDVKPKIISALSAVPKPDSNEIRLIHDCSQPAGFALNDYADIESFKYQSLQDGLAFLRPGYYMAKIDLRHAYRSVHIHPSNYQATGLKWKFSNSNHFTYFVDTRLPYGGRRAPGIFHCLTQAVKRMMARRGYKMIVYLDDFLIVASSWTQCMEAYECLLELLQNLGFEISFRKVVPPTQCLTFLGVQIDSVGQYLSLPQNKLVDLQAFVQEFLYRRRASKRQLQVLAGKLNWACQVVFGGRTFLRRILDAMNSLQSPSARFRFTPEFYADLLWWSKFLQVFNEKRMFLDAVPELNVQTDACFEAAGAFFNGDWRYLILGQSLKFLQICI